MEMEKEILNLEEAAKFLEVGERTLLKLLRDEHIPARKIGREWRFSRYALLQWLAEGDSFGYTNKDEVFEVFTDEEKDFDLIIKDLLMNMKKIEKEKLVNELLSELPRKIEIPEILSLRVSYKQKKEIEQLAFKLFWPIRDEKKF